MTDEELINYKEAFKKYYSTIMTVFNYYASLDASTTYDLSCIGLNATHLFTLNTGLESDKAKFVTHKDIDLIFATVNVEVEQDAATKVTYKTK